MYGSLLIGLEVFIAFEEFAFQSLEPIEHSNEVLCLKKERFLWLENVSGMTRAFPSSEFRDPIKRDWSFFPDLLDAARHCP